MAGSSPEIVSYERPMTSGCGSWASIHGMSALGQSSWRKQLVFVWTPWAVTLI